MMRSLGDWRFGLVVFGLAGIWVSPLMGPKGTDARMIFLATGLLFVFVGLALMLVKRSQAAYVAAGIALIATLIFLFAEPYME